MPKNQRLLVVCLCVCAAAPWAGAQTPAASHACAVRTAPLSAGEIALARGDSDAAVAAFSSEMSSAHAERAHNGRIRALLAANKLDVAETDAKAWLVKSPRDPWARASLGEVQLRQGQIPAAFNTLQAALGEDACIAQTHADLARVYALTAMFATARHLVDAAHALDPVDDAIEQQWLESEPPAAQSDEIAHYLQAAAPYLSDERRAELVQRQKRLALAATDTCRLASPAASTVIPYFFIQNGSNARVFWGLQVKINGKTLDLAEDSTISGILLRQSAVKEAHLDPLAGVEVTGIGSTGGVTAGAARAASIRVGPLEFQNCDVLVAQDEMKVYGQTAWEQVHHVYLDRGSDGLIGPDAFRDFLITLDKPGRQIKLDPLPQPPGSGPAPEVRLLTGVAPASEPLHDRSIDPSMRGWAPEFRSGQFFLFPLRLQQGPIALYSMATNSIQNTISLDLARQLKIVSVNPRELPSMTGQNGHYYPTGDVTLDFLGMHERVASMSALDTTEWSHHHGVELTGMLGKPMLDQFTLHLDYRDNLMRLDFDPRRIVNCPPNLANRLPGCY